MRYLFAALHSAAMLVAAGTTARAASDFETQSGVFLGASLGEAAYTEDLPEGVRFDAWAPAGRSSAATGSSGT